MPAAKEGIMPLSYSGDGLWLEHGCGPLAGRLDAAECKGPGHPDRLADDLAESLSRVYAGRTLERYGAPLHHNFDKLALLGGEAEVRYGQGRLVAPIRVQVNGRVATRFAGQAIPWGDWLSAAVGEFFAARLPGLELDRDLRVDFNLSTASSPGRVITGGPGSSGGRHHWFEPRDLDDLRERRELLANDTCFGTGFAPLSTPQRLARDLSVFLGRLAAPWLGTDTKVMTCGHGSAPGDGAPVDHVDAIVCAPILAAETRSRSQYVDHLRALERAIREFVRESFPGVGFSLVLNNRDRLEEDEIYLTAVGTSLESGDEGLVGRGNRLNGLITPFAPMSLEGVHGKNPVYHAGKIYNLLAQRIVADLHRRIGGQVQVNLISATGAPLDRPWRIQVRTERGASLEEVGEVVEKHLSQVRLISRALISGEALSAS